MHAIKGEYRDGKVYLEEKADWPEHTEVRVEPLEATIGMREEDWSDTPEAIAEWMAWYDSLEPWLSPGSNKRYARWRGSSIGKCGRSKKRGNHDTNDHCAF